MNKSGLALEAKMKISPILKQSIIALKRNKLRSLLSVLGIVVGVGAVVLLLSLGQGLKALVTNQIEAFGPNLLDIAVKVPGKGQLGTLRAMAQGIKITTLKLDDVKALRDKERFPYVKAVAGQAIAQEWAVYRDKEKRVVLYGTNAQYPLIVKSVQPAQGRFFTQAEENQLAKVVVLGNQLAKDFFRSGNAVGQFIKIKGRAFKVIGVLEEQSGLSFGGIDPDYFVYLPIQTNLKEILGIDYLSEIILALGSSTDIPRAKMEISRLLRFRHQIKDPAKDDFQITTMEQILGQVNEIGFILNLLLGFLAGISLLVGGIGIMNIMLVSVSERTREIGLRKALGASPRAILSQFLVEGLVITVLGGLAGTIAGVGCSLVGALMIRSQGLAWPLTISWLSVIIGVGLAGWVGLFFSLWPAYRAAQLDPIKALRRE